MDRKSRQRLEGGNMPIERRLDLHGHSQDTAKAALESFIMGAYKDGVRCVLVITGHGRRQIQNEENEFWRDNPGILRVRLPEWLSMKPFSEIILRIVQAQPKHGGDGAFYIYMRKKK